MAVPLIPEPRLGHMGIKFAHALGAKVVMITRSASKGQDAKALGADAVLLSHDAAEMEKYANQFDFLLNTIPTRHDVNPYVNLLKRDASMVMVGAIEPLGGSVEELSFATILLYLVSPIRSDAKIC